MWKIKEIRIKRSKSAHEKEEPHHRIKALDFEWIHYTESAGAKILLCLQRVRQRNFDWNYLGIVSYSGTKNSRF